jgi:hypothetical protein
VGSELLPPPFYTGRVAVADPENQPIEAGCQSAETHEL